MKMLLKKLRRDIRETFGQFISIICIIAVGAFFFAGMNSAVSSLNHLVYGYYDECNLADGWSYFMAADDSTIEQIKTRKPGIVDIEGRLTFSGIRRKKIKEKDELMLHSLTSVVNKPKLIAGALPSQPNECLVDETYCAANSLGIGDDLVAEIDVGNEKRKIAFCISGIFNSAEYLVKSTDSGISDRSGFCVVLADAQYIRDELEVSDVYSEILFTTNGMVDVASLMRGIDGYLYTRTRKTVISTVSYDATMGQISKIVAIFPTIFFLVAAILTYICMSKNVENQRGQIGVMQAIGIKKSGIYFIYLAYAFLACIIGAVLGGIAGLVVVPQIFSGVFSIQFILPAKKLVPYLAYVVWALFLFLAIALIAALISIRGTLKQKPSEILRPKPPKNSKPILLERWKGFWKRSSFSTKIIARNLFLNKGRILMSTIGIIGCIALLIAAFGMKDRVDYTIHSYEITQEYDARLTLTKGLPALADGTYDKSLITSIDPNVKDAEYVGEANLILLGGNLENLQLVPTKVNLLENDAKLTSLYDYRTKEKVHLDSTSVAISHMLAEQYGFSAGDTILAVVPMGVKSSTDGTANTPQDRLSEIVRLLFPDIFENISIEVCYVTITDVVEQYLDSSVTTTFEWIRNNIKGVADGRLQIDVRKINVTMHDPSTAEETIETLQSSDLVQNTLTFRQVMDGIQDIMTLLNVIVLIIVVGAAVLSMTVIYNITSINIHERTRELSTLMVLGYRKKEITRLLISDNLIITGLGCLVGLPFGIALFRYVLDVVTVMALKMPSQLTFAVVATCFVLAFAFTLLSTFLLNRKISNINMAEALKSVE